MRELDQLLLNFNFNKSYRQDDYFVSESNLYAFNLVNSWPKWERNIINICGEKYSGKTHLSKIFYNKSNCIIIDSASLKNEKLYHLRFYENVILENFNINIDEKSFFSLFNFIDQNKKYLLINSQIPISEVNFKLKDLTSRTKNCLIANIEKPDDKLIKVLILKNLSDRQVTVDMKLIDYVVKRITRSYGKIFEFIYKIDEMSLKKKKINRFKVY